jgi:hypothetical protein
MEGAKSRMSAIKYDSCSAAITDMIEDPHDNGDYRLHIEGENLKHLWDAAEASDKRLATAIACLKLIAEQGGGEPDFSESRDGEWCAEQAREVLKQLRGEP